MAPRTSDQIAPHYDRGMRPLDRWFLARLRETIFQYLPEDGRILEIGAGTGLNFVYYPNNALAVASEPSREMLKVAQSKSRPERAHLIQSCAEHLPFADNSFDAAFATLVWMGERLVFRMPYETFVKITKAKTFEIRFDGVRFRLSEKHLGLLRAFAKRMGSN